MTPPTEGKHTQPQLERAQPATSESGAAPQLERPQLERVWSMSPVAASTSSFGVTVESVPTDGEEAESAAAALTSSIPPPDTSRAVSISVALTSSGDQSGCSSNTSAA